MVATYAPDQQATISLSAYYLLHCYNLGGTVTPTELR